MTLKEFSQAVYLAEKNELSNIDDSVLYGLALPDFKPVVTTLFVCAKFIRYHCLYINGSWDSEALNNMAALMRHRVKIV